MDSKSTYKILIIGPAWVGDMVMAQSLFMALQQRHEAADITVLAPAWTRPLLDRMPEVTQSIDLDLSHGELSLGKRRQLGKGMRKQGFQQAIVLPNSFKSALIPFHAGIPERTAWVGEFRWPLLNDARRLNKNVFAGMVERFVALAYPASPEPPADCPNPRLLVNEESQTKAVGQFHLDGEGPVLGICPGAEFGPAKQWPAEHYAELANSLLGEGWRVWFFGSISDQLVTESIMADIEPAHFDRCANLVGKTTLGQAIDLLACSRVVASNDSGLMHVAAALGKPIVAMYGSTSSDFTPPLADRVKLLSTDIECRPCFKRECPYGHLRCLNELNPGLAIDAVAELIDTAPQN